MKTTESGEKVRLAFKGNKVVEAKSLGKENKGKKGEWSELAEYARKKR